MTTSRLFAGLAVLSLTLLMSTATWAVEEEAKLIAPDGGSGDRFGWGRATAIRGDLAAVGAITHAEGGVTGGAVYVYRRVDGEWTFEQELTAPDPSTSELFGWSVEIGNSIRGDFIVVGAIFGNRAFIFRDTANEGWVMEQEVTGADAEPGSNYGVAVDCVSTDDGDLVIVGGEWHSMDPADHDGVRSGAAWIWRNNGSGWVEEAELRQSDDDDRDQFGFEVGLTTSGGQPVAIVSAWLDDELGENAGAAYIFRYDGSTWVEEEKLTASDGEAGDVFGAYADIDGDVAVVGAPDDDNAAGVDAGSVYVFHFDGSAWIQVAKLTASDAAEGDFFGGELKVDGDTILAGGKFETTEPGTVYMFRYDGATWAETDAFEMSDGMPGDGFEAVALDGNMAVIGAARADNENGPNAGSAYVIKLFGAVDPNADSDGDGLLDVWELNGYTHENGEFVDLPALGADPRRKDVFVEIDYMAGCAPQQEALDVVIQAFADAPVSNPDGSSGITLHVLVNEELAHVTMLGTLSGDEYFWTRPAGSPVTHFDDLQSLHFAEERETAFHYCIWADRLPGAYSGMSRGAPASHLVVAMGDLIDAAGTGHSEVRWEAGTFMHELGHNLGLEHGGADTTNYKPNYLSIMNYTFQLDGLLVGGTWEHFDYSRAELDPLDESDLDESIGLVPASNAMGYGTVWWWAVAWDTGDGIVYVPLRHSVTDATGPINWRWTEDDVPQTINQDPDTEILTGHDDWANLIFSGSLAGGGIPMPLPATTPVEELDVETAQAVWRLPWPVRMLNGHVTQNRLDLTWKPAGSAPTVAEYWIYRDGEHIGTSTTSNYMDDTVEAGATHTYFVTWVNDLGQESVPSETVELTLSK